MTRTATAARRRSRAKARTVEDTPAPLPTPTPDTKSVRTAEPEPVPSAAKIALPRAPTKLALIIAALCGDDGATVADLAALTGWKVNSVRGVLAGTLKTRHGLMITSVKADGVRVYRAAAAAAE